MAKLKSAFSLLLGIVLGFISLFTSSCREEPPPAKPVPKAPETGKQDEPKKEDPESPEKKEDEKPPKKEDDLPVRRPILE